MTTRRPAPSPPRAAATGRPLLERLQSTLLEPEAPAPREASHESAATGSAASRGAASRTPVSVSELTEKLSRQIAKGFSSVCVMGEISEVKVVASGHTFFTLKDSGATLDAMIWADRKAGLAVAPKDGLRVIAMGALRVYAAKGRYRLHVDALELVGAGDLQRALEVLKARLLEEGLFAESRKRPLPGFVSTVGLVTSPTGAVRHDIERTLSRGEARVRLLLSPTRVQGEGAAVEIATAIGLLAQRADVDVIVVARGGGSVEELWPFNDEVVARAIVASRPPVISAVGHETDFTIADLAADVRASTPSVAAGLIVDIQRQANLRASAGAAALQKAIEKAQEGWRRRLDVVSTHRVIERERTKLERLRHRVLTALAEVRSASETRRQSRRNGFRDLLTRYEARAPTELFARAHVQVERAVSGMSARVAADLRRRGLQFADDLGLLKRSAGPAVSRRRSQLSGLASRLDALSPLAVLSRGYALATTPAGRILTSARDVSVGDLVRVRLHRGRVLAKVTEREEET